MATIISLQICTAHRAPMQFKPRVQAIGNLGLAGDRHAHPNGSRQVLLMDEETLNKFQLKPGAVKENITTRGLNLYVLAPARLKIGDVVLEVTKLCEPCERMNEIRQGLREELIGQRGLLARVVRGGELRVGDEIEILGSQK